jgi:hypothetical protein
LSADDEVRLRYEAREKAWRDEQGCIAFGIDKGIKQGREEVLELLGCGESLESILHRYDTKTTGGK